MGTSPFDICNRALIRVGAKMISSFDESTTESIAAGTEYDAAVREALADHPWRFALRQVELNKLSGSPIARWASAYQIPGDVITIRAVTDQLGRTVLYGRQEDKIVTDETHALFMDYTARVPEALWHPAFTRALVVTLSATFAKVLLADLQMASALRDEAENIYWPRARSADSQQQTTRRLPRSRLLAVR